MKLANTLTTIALVGSTIVAPAAVAQETVLQSLITRMIDSAVEVTVTELHSQAAQSVANTAYHMSLDSLTNTPQVAQSRAKVKITSLDSDSTDATESTKSE
ncbi:hypothetical protein [Alteromonas oceanisediminis]|uniref:hypothetical protein n=1 Tax=Alteromonas oceanisediminis TaxID=2836180 RepID=UPI001BDB09FE|nr:hypothetical protein [Alteromonas oceanisediminis]MBT0585863.1 hypothetical protein [Alteromonas oceanisediminis]